MISTSQQQPLSISQLNLRARQLLETHLQQVWIAGEISNLTMHSSGHWYFTLKDAKAQIRCAMFRGDNSKLRFKPQHGMQIIARGRVSLYEGRGDYQLIADYMQPAGVGDLQAAFEQLKAKLGAEGLFNPEFKQPLPTHPKHIAIVSSAQAAALQDILTAFKRRNPGILLSIVPVPVQGEGAGLRIARAIQLLNQSQFAKPIDAIIIARGGGSLEDLWAFNEEVVARAIFSSEIPIVSGVGHETDFTIADFVADVRAPTPTAAAELLSPNLQELRQRLNSFHYYFQSWIQKRLSQQRREYQLLAKRLQHPSALLRQKQQQNDWLYQRLERSLRAQLQAQAQQCAHLSLRLKQQEPKQQLLMLRQRLQRAEQQLLRAPEQIITAQKQCLTPLTERLLRSPQWYLTQPQQRLLPLTARLNAAITPAINQPKQRLALAAKVLQTVNPLQTLERGYAIAFDDKQRAVSDANLISTGDKLTVRLHRGQLECEVLSSTAADD